MSRPHRMSFVFGSLVICASGFAVVLSLQAARWIEQAFFPVNIKWQVTTVEVLGNDLVVSGTMVKDRACDYKPPPRAFSSTGAPMAVRSQSATAGQNWPPGPTPRPFGPWVIVDGAKDTPTLYQEHWCHLGWAVWSKLGSVNANGQVE